MFAVGDSAPGVWTIYGRTPAERAVGSVTVRFEDGTEPPAAHGPGWFVFLVDPARLRPGHRPVGIDITRTDGHQAAPVRLLPGLHPAAARGRPRREHELRRQP